MPAIASPVRRLLLAAAGTLLALSSLSARAGFQSDITVKLIAPGGAAGLPDPINEQQTVSVANLATGLQARAPGAITGFWMLDNEEVAFVGESIHVRTYAGFESGSSLLTGYFGSGAEHARYVFDGLSIAGKTIVGFNVSVFDGYANSGFVGLAGPSASSLVHLIDADSLSLDLDDILFVRRGNGTAFDHADFRIDLITQDAGPGPGGPGGPGDPGNPGNRLPEPATLALFLTAALGAGLARRRG